ncbi:hypothetical protein FA13DRAFT_1706436 [Coprinellus micaceus]|uniref:Uncharacterized protein n=1 Tax=Coprinellus micaceus TaxID=71717 RepID=A0A4Y7TQE8_COPMI|nr:hypothetical protein FA13DRAFT_1706436 [Coprinellus micaceus]
MQSTLLSALIATSAALGGLASPLGNRTEGDASLHKRFTNSRWTFYDVGLGACGETNVNSDYIVALNADQFGSGYPGPNCGKSITLNAPGAPYGGLDLSRGLFNHFASEDVGVLSGEWDFVDSSSGSSTTTTKSATTSAAKPTTSSKTAATTSRTPNATTRAAITKEATATTSLRAATRAASVKATSSLSSTPTSSRQVAAPLSSAAGSTHKTVTSPSTHSAASSTHHRSNVTATASAPIANASTPADEEYCEEGQEGGEEGQEGGEELASSTVSPSASTTKAASRVAAFAQPTTSSPVLPLLVFKKL